MSPHFYEKIDTYVKKSVKKLTDSDKKTGKQMGGKAKGWRKNVGEWA